MILAYYVGTVDCIRNGVAFDLTPEDAIALRKRFEDAYPYLKEWRNRMTTKLRPMKFWRSDSDGEVYADSAFAAAEGREGFHAVELNDLDEDETICIADGGYVAAGDLMAHDGTPLQDLSIEDDDEDEAED